MTLEDEVEVARIAWAIMEHDNSSQVEWKKDAEPDDSQWILARSLWRAGVRWRIDG